MILLLPLLFVLLLLLTQPTQKKWKTIQRRKELFLNANIFYSHDSLLIGAKGFGANYPRTSILKQFEYLTIEMCTKVDKNDMNLSIGESSSSRRV